MNLKEGGFRETIDSTNKELSTWFLVVWALTSLLISLVILSERFVPGAFSYTEESATEATSNWELLHEKTNVSTVGILMNARQIDTDMDQDVGSFQYLV